MQTIAPRDCRMATNSSTVPAVAGLFIYDCDSDGPHVLIPRPEVQLVVRFGPLAQDGLDIYAFGARQKVHRKFILSGQRTATARLRLGASGAVFGVPASAMAGQVVAIEDLWGVDASLRLHARLAKASHTAAATAILEGAIAERLAKSDFRPDLAPLALAAADRLAGARLSTVAFDLGVSERHLRRVFRETVGVNPKAFAKLQRFRRALSLVRADASASWAGIASLAGYYDQAHLIAEFRSIAGVTPQALLGELRAAPLIG